MLITCLREPLACLFCCAVGRQGIENAALPGFGQGTAPQNRNAVYAVAYLPGIYIDISGRSWAKCPQRGQPLPGNTPAADYPNMGMKGVVFLKRSQISQSSAKSPSRYAPHLSTHSLRNMTEG